VNLLFLFLKGDIDCGGGDANAKVQVLLYVPRVPPDVGVPALEKRARLELLKRTTASDGVKAEQQVMIAWKKFIDSSSPYVRDMLPFDEPSYKFWQNHLYNALNVVARSAGDGRLVGNDFIPLPNFQPDDIRFWNTCFIAVVVNLRNLVPDIARVLDLQNSTWKEVIRVVRGMCKCKYHYNAEHCGQHDAAELLGDILFEAAGYGFLLSKERLTSGPVVTHGQLKAGCPCLFCH